MPFVLGLACGQCPNTFYTEYLLATVGMAWNQVARITYRKKLPDRPANNFGFMAVAHDGRRSRVIEWLGLPYFLWRNAYFRCDACNFCRDVFAEAADACFMDAWLPEYCRNPLGHSIAIVRSEELRNLFRRGASRGELGVSPIEAERVVASQSGHVHTKQTLIRYRLAGRAGGSTRGLATPRERLDWWLARRTRTRSKLAWGRLGRRCGPASFWLAMLDLVFLQTVVRGALLYAAKLVRWGIDIIRPQSHSAADHPQESQVV